MDSRRRKESEDSQPRLTEAEAGKPAGAGADWLRVLFDSLFEGVLLHEDGIILDGNQAVADMFGYDISEAIGTPVFKYIDPEYHDRAKEHIGSGSEEPYELLCVRMDGSRFPAEIRARNRTYEDRRIRIVTVRDMTEQKRTEEELLNTRERFRMLFEHAPDAYYLNDMKGVFVEGNLAAENLIGYSKEELIGKSFLKLKLLPASQIPKAAKLVARNALGKSTGPDELILKRKDGSRVDVEILTAPIKIEGRDLVLGIARDITERKKTEDALRESEANLRHLFETMAEGVIWLSPDNEILRANPAAERILKLKPSEIEGAPFLVPDWEIIRPDNSPMPLEEMAGYRAMHERRPVKNIIMGLKKVEGSVAWINCGAIPLIDNSGELQGAVGTFFDITSQKELEEQLLHSQKMEAVGRLAGGIAHDFNNVLTVILGNAEISLMKMHREDPLHERLEGIEKAARHAETLTRQLLAFSRKQIIQPQLLDLNSVLAHLYPMLKRLIGEDIELISNRDRQICTVMADPGQIEQILVNLIINARQAMPVGGEIMLETGEVELDRSYVRTHPYIKPGRYAMLAVSDTGHGMTDEVTAQIFEPFFTTKEEGTGLGLSTVYGIVRQSGGSIIVYSEVGVGTTFKIYLPEAEKDARIEGAEETVEAMHGKSETILLVEDEAAVRELTTEILEGLGYAVHPCEGADEAERIYRENEGKVDLLLSDVVMPGRSGVELTQRLKQLDPSMRVLYMSGYTDDAIVHHGVLDREMAFLAKPFTPAVLAKKVREVLDE